MLSHPLLLLFLLCFYVQGIVGNFQVVVPSTPPSRHLVQSNFLGISFELSSLNQYFGNSTSTIPSSFLNSLSALRGRTGGFPLRLRIGGNSVDNSVYTPTQTSSLIQPNDGSGDANVQSVTYGPVIWDVLNQVSSNIGGATYLIGLPLDPNESNISVLADGAVQKLGNNLDGFLLGNEPDLYSQRGVRPNDQNYTSGDYLTEFQTVSNQLMNTSSGNILNKHDLGGPGICCTWDLKRLLDDGFSSKFGGILKYISLQHYPQNNCDTGYGDTGYGYGYSDYGYGGHKYNLTYYTQHANVVNISTWQGAGINQTLSNNGQQVIMSEFNSASCGGIRSISDTYAAGSLWTADYALQLASVGYSAAYIHTRERSNPSNLFTPPNTPNSGSWTTNPPFYALLAVSEALRSNNGSSIVTDLNINGSAQNASASVSGYAVYDAGDSSVQQLVLFNWANVSSSQGLVTPFDIPSGVFKSKSAKSVLVKYLVGDTMQAHDNIGWGGQTLANTTDGKLILGNSTWSPPNVEVDCRKGCTVEVPAPGMAVLFGAGVANGTNLSSTKSPELRVVPSRMLGIPSCLLIIAASVFLL